MIDPISNQQFSHDYQKFVFQDLSAIPVPPYGTPKLPFENLLVKKTKKDLNKDKSPFEIKQKKDESKEEEEKNKDTDEEKSSEEINDEKDEKSS